MSIRTQQQRDDSRREAMSRYPDDLAYALELEAKRLATLALTTNSPLLLFPVATRADKAALKTRIAYLRARSAKEAEAQAEVKAQTEAAAFRAAAQRREAARDSVAWSLQLLEADARDAAGDHARARAIREEVYERQRRDRRNAGLTW